MKYVIIKHVLFERKSLLVLVPLVLIIAIVAFYSFHIPRKIEMRVLGLHTQIKNTQQPQEINVEGKIKVKYPQDYTIVMLGDSMTEKLGNSDELRAYLRKYYPQKSFEILNYGFGSTNILSAQDRLEKQTFHGRDFRPILDIDFDLILIESFGNNPLSDFPLEEGLKKQTTALDKIVETIKATSPNAKIAFVATISPNKENYARGQVELSNEKRAEWAGERIAYIKNHINYAKTRQIPIINIYEKSLDNNQDGKLDYISSDDFIHPSPNGVYFISEEIAKFISANQILLP